MKQVWKKIRKRRYLETFLFASIAFAMVQLFTRHSGIGVSPDSIAYLGAARNMENFGALKDYSLKPLVDFPVFYPLFLSVIGWISHTDLVKLLPMLNGCLFAGVVILTGYLLDKRENVTSCYKWIVLGMIVISPTLLEVYYMLWSETLFLLLTLLFIAVFYRYLQQPSYKLLSLCCGVAAIACITRYAGVTLIATGLMLILFNKNLLKVVKIIHFILFGMISSSLLFLNLGYNAMVSGSLTGPRQAGIVGLGDNLVFYGRVVINWVGGWTDQAQIVALISMLLFLLACVLFIRRAGSNRHYHSVENCLAAYFIVYTVFIIGISTLSHFEQINSRLLAPAFIPFLITVSSWIPESLQQNSNWRQKLALLGIALLTLCSFLRSLSLDKELFIEADTYGIPGYTADAWRSSATAKFLREQPQYFDPAYELYSNVHEATYFNGALISQSIPQIVDHADAKKFFEKDGLYLIWFDDFSDNELLKFQTISEHATLIKLKDFEDGEIYFIKPRPFSQQPQ